MPTSPPSDPLIGRLVDGRYRVRARIARGGMATVYVATDLRLERRVALKVMHGHLSDDEVFQSRFIQEARAAARLADPHVVNVFDQGQDGDMAYLVMEYLPGTTLRELMREQRRLTVPQAITIMDAVLSGLGAAHRAGIVHRDVKPENVLLSEDGRIKIGDFGLARATTANTASGAMLLGTIAYLAPELVTRGSADARSDIYALGILLYEMLVGEQPYKGEQPMQIAYQHATESVPRPSAKAPGVPEALDELVLWATAKEPDDRPVDADAMLQELRKVEKDLGIAPQVARTLAVGTTVREPSRDSREFTAVLPSTVGVDIAPEEEADNAGELRARQRRRAVRGAWVLALVVVLVLAAGGTGWWFGSGPGSQVGVPDLAGQTSDEARAVLEDLTLVAQSVDVFNLTVEPGRIVATEPSAGTPIDKDSVVTLLVSQGPRPVDIPALAGRPAAEARATLIAATLGVAETDTEQFDDAEAGAVLDVRIAPRTGDAVDCAQGCSVHEGDVASLVVSLGPVPDVAGMSVGDATRTLRDVRLEVSESAAEEFSDAAPAGQVLGIQARDGGGAWRPGETVTLRVSKGPELFAVPDVTGMSRDAAKAELSAAGFRTSYTAFWDSAPDAFTQVTSQDPAAGSMRARSTVISLTITGNF